MIGRENALPAYWYQSRSRYYLVNHGRAYAALTDMLVATALVGWKLRRLLQGEARSIRHIFCATCCATARPSAFAAAEARKID